MPDSDDSGDRKRMYRQYRKVYEHCYGAIPKDDQGRAFDIHHIDGDCSNNHPANLQAVSIQEHYDIHYEQEDWSACQAMALRMKKSYKEIAKLASFSSRRRVREGTHNWLDGEKTRQRNLQKVREGTHPFLGGKIQKRNALKMVQEGTNPFLAKNLQTHICPFCNKTGVGPAMKRWHFYNCREKGNYYV